MTNESLSGCLHKFYSDYYPGDKDSQHDFMKYKHPCDLDLNSNLNVKLVRVDSCDIDLDKLLFPLIAKDTNGNYLYLTKSEQNIGIQQYQLWQCIPVSRAKSVYDVIKDCVNVERKSIFKFFGFGILLSSSSLIPSIIIAFLISNMSLISSYKATIICLIALLFCLAMTAIKIFIDINFKFTKYRILLAFTSSLWDKMVTLSFADVSRLKSAELIQSVNDAEQGLERILQIIGRFTVAVSTFFGLFAILLYLGQMLAVVVITVSIIFMVARIIFSIRSSKHYVKRLSIKGKISGFTNEILMQIDNVISSNSYDVLTNRYQQTLSSEIFEANYQNQYSIKESLITYIESTSVLLLIYSFVFFDIASSTYMLIPFILIFMQLHMSLVNIADSITNVIQSYFLIKRVFPLYENNQPLHSDRLHIPSFNGKITVNALSYKYSSQSQFVLNDVNLEIKQGQYVALIGCSGSGKSTFLRLLTGLDENYEGIIKIDGKNLKDISLASYRNNIGVITQDATLIQGSIYENISFGKNISIDEAWHYARMVNLEQEILLMPMKMYTHIADNNSESVSGGQKQKILLARMLAKKPKILFLDEAINSIDNISLEIIDKTLKQLDITRIVIAHRLHSVENADVIYELKSGSMRKVSKNNSSRLSRKKSLVSVNTREDHHHLLSRYE